MAFETNARRTRDRKYYLPNVEIKDYNAMIDWKFFFDQPVKNNKITYKKNIRKIAMSQRDDCTTG